MNKIYLGSLEIIARIDDPTPKSLDNEFFGGDRYLLIDGTVARAQDFYKEVRGFKDLSYDIYSQKGITRKAKACELKYYFEHFGLSFDYQLNDLNSKLELAEELLATRKNNIALTYDDIHEFIDEYTEWNICDCCGKIDKSTNLVWIGERDNLFDRDYQIAKFMTEALDPGLAAVCSECFDDFKDMTFLSLETINNRLSANQCVYDIGDKVYVTDRQHPLFSKIVTIDKAVEQYFYKVEDCAIHLKDDMLFDMVNYALTEEFSQVVSKHTNRIDEYDEFTGGISSADLKCCFEEFGLKNEFREYLNKNNFKRFLDYIQ